MITTDQEYSRSREKLASLAGLIASTETRRAGDQGFRDRQLAGLRGFAGDLRVEFADYETRRKQS